ncbi:energy transducer TonB [Lacinutrix sp. Bg11-31]|uniref:energy transducer TonB n=1 Tax=Lacinutrix sp. Bg11-31 TaxID=2057808 RepID=UPI000C30E5AA|nr:energy transducer TonB [Lacinutrix sp. Bg11-31]AUC80612.1 energy transducer TonB [Lacinutrix sp. Bg11-31]
MKYLKTKHEQNSAKITALIVVILILLCFVVGQDYQDPPEEYGVAVNFGNSAVGSGNMQPDKPVKSEDLDINKQPQEAQSEPNKAEEQTDETQEAAASEEIKEDALTQDIEEAIAIKKTEALKKAKAEADAKAKEAAAKKAKAKVDAEVKKKAEEAKKRAEIDAMMGGMNNSDGESSGSEGNDNEAGDKGQLDGNPYAPSYFGGGKGNGGVGSGLGGRGQGKFSEVKQDCNEEGLVVVLVEVDRNGKVVKATPGVQGTENTAPCLLEPARKIAESGKWPADSKAPTRQIGFVSIDFKLGQ